MKRIRPTTIVALLIVVLIVIQMIDYRDGFHCYVKQQESMYRPVYDSGLATPSQIRERVWNDTVAGFDGFELRARLDGLYHDIFMAGDRNDQVAARLQNSPTNDGNLGCWGEVYWIISDDRGLTAGEAFHGADMETGHKITAALESLSEEDLGYYTVTAYAFSNQLDYDGQVAVTVTIQRRLGRVSAQDWHNGNTVPEFWSGWYAAWLENNQELQSPDES